MNDTIRTQLAHSSVRAFTNEPVTAELRTRTSMRRAPRPHPAHCK